MQQLLDKLPPALANRLRTRVVRQFSRFAMVAIVSLAASELTLSIAYLAGVTGGRSTLLGWFVGAVISYLLSRWAWNRKGRPDLLRETLPFWLISIGTAVLLTATGHIAGTAAKSHHLPKLDAVALVATAYLLMNMVTFICRFLLLHFVLFADRSSGGGAAGSSAGSVEAESLAVVTVPASADREDRPPRP